MNHAVLALQGVTKSFGPIEVLHGIDLALHSGKVHALIGENGAGKSTAMKILAGYQEATEGRILVDGTPTVFANLHDGEQAGVVMIHQEFNLAEQLTVEQNIFLGREINNGLLLNKRQMYDLTREYLDKVQCKVDPDAKVSSLSNSDKQMVEIAKALSRNARVLIMDEPTAVLTRKETNVLFEQVRALQAANTAILFTSHKLDEVADVADDVTVMRDGSVVHAGPAAEIDEDSMATAMVGRDVSDLYPSRSEDENNTDEGNTDTVLSVNGLNVPGFATDLSFELAKGEILGIGGLIGSGRTEAMEGLCGIRPARTTSLKLFGNSVSINKPGDAIDQGLCYLTEDRKLRGLILGWDMRKNLTLQTLFKFSRWLINRRAEEAALDKAITEFDVRAGSRSVKVGNLSGGNQQKLLLAKVMLSEPRILIIDEPTRGIDIGTKQQIYVFLRQLADKGHSIIVVSSEMSELIGLADRVLVMRLGQIAGQLTRSEISEDSIVRLSMGLEATPGQQASAAATTTVNPL